MDLYCLRTFLCFGIGFALVCKVMAFEYMKGPPLSEAEIPYIVEAFHLFDTDNDGSIAIDELRHVVDAFNQRLTIHEIKDMVYAVDSDDNTVLNINEFVMIVNQMRMKTKMREEIYEKFRQLDKDGSGHISAEELRNTLNKYGEKFSDDEIHDIISDADIDSNGLLEYKVPMSPVGTIETSAVPELKAMLKNHY